MDQHDKEAGRPLGYGNVESRPAVDGADATGAGSGESGGGAYPNKAGSEAADAPGQAYTGPSTADANAVSRDSPALDDKEATRDRTA